MFEKKETIFLFKESRVCLYDYEFSNFKFNEKDGGAWFTTKRVIKLLLINSFFISFHILHEFLMPFVETLCVFSIFWLTNWFLKDFLFHCYGSFTYKQIIWDIFDQLITVVNFIVRKWIICFHYRFFVKVFFDWVGIFRWFLKVFR